MVEGGWVGDRGGASGQDGPSPANLASGGTALRPHHDPAFGPAKLRGVAPLCAAERVAPVVSFGDHRLGP
jgi:hypothetical protein